MIDFDMEAEAREIARSAGNSLARQKRAYIGRPTDPSDTDLSNDIRADDVIGLANSYYIRLDSPDNPIFTYAVSDVYNQTQEYTYDAIVRVRPYFLDQTTSPVRWTILGADELLIGQQFGSIEGDPAAGFTNVPVHNHTSNTTGGTLDINTLVGILASAYGGTGIDMPATIADDAAVLVFNTATEQVEAANWQAGGLIIGADVAAPAVLNPTKEGDIAEAYDTGATFSFNRLKSNNYTATVNPSVNDDETDNYRKGSKWYNETTGVLFYCKDATTAAAVWIVWTIGLNKVFVDTVDPTVTDDVDAGYGVNSLGFNTATQAAFICWDASTGAADWQSIGGTPYTPPLNNMTATAPPTTSDDDTMGYGENSTWYDGVALTMWICRSASTGAAEWVQIWGYSSIPTQAINTASGATYSLDITNYFIKVNAASNNVTVELPPAASMFGRQFVIKRIDNSGNTVTIDGDGTETIDGATTQPLTTQYQSMTVISDGTEWWIVATA